MNSRKTLLCTILANGSFTTSGEMNHSIEELLKAYENEDNPLAAEDADAEAEAKLRQYLRQTGEVASGKRVFLTDELDIGLGFSTIRKGDIVCVLYGSRMPCILRKEDISQHGYTVVGLCYLHGWMDGTRNPRSRDWWNETPESFVLV